MTDRAAISSQGTILITFKIIWYRFLFPLCLITKTPHYLDSIAFCKMGKLSIKWSLGWNEW